MSNKIGEAQGIDFFREAFRSKFEDIYGKSHNYSIGVFSGSQDRKFADFFAGTASTCMLIEFKEYEREIKDELQKPLRKKLCSNLSDERAKLSRGSHYIAFRSKSSNVEVQIAPYVDVVCPQFGIGCPPLEQCTFAHHDNFIDDFFAGRAGSPYDDFVTYAGRLSNVAGGIADGQQAPFKAMVYSRSDAGKVIATTFENLHDFKKLMAKKPKRISTFVKKPKLGR